MRAVTFRQDDLGTTVRKVSDERPDWPGHVPWSSNSHCSQKHKQTRLATHELVESVSGKIVQDAHGLHTWTCSTSSSVSTLLSTRLDGLAPEGGARVLDMLTPLRNLPTAVDAVSKQRLSKIRCFCAGATRTTSLFEMRFIHVTNRFRASTLSELRFCRRFLLWALCIIFKGDTV